MRDFARRVRSFLAELKRRKIFRAAVVYGTVAFVVLQAAAVIFPALHLPGWSLTLLVVVAILGFPLVLALEWVFEVTSEGIRREPAMGHASQPREPAEDPEGLAGETQSRAPDSGTGQAPPAAPRSALERAVRRPVVVVPATVVLILGLAAAWVLHRAEPEMVVEPTLSSTVIAVLPFSVRGGEDARYLGEGIVNLLGTALDGAGLLRTVDARAMFGTLAQEGGGLPDLERGHRLAERLGAGLFVLGDIVQAGDRFHLEAAVYDAAGVSEPRTRAAVSGEASRLFELVDDLAARLLAGLGDDSADRFTRTAAVTTASFPAFKAYLDGEAHVRAGRFERAAESYLQAIAHDSTFAIAYYRLALVRDWAALPGSPEAASAAVRHAERLTPRDRALLEAFRAWVSADAVEAERRYRDILARYPDDLEAWFHLGETLFHFGPLRGRSISESEDAWRRVLVYEPRELYAALHLARVAALGGRVAAIDSLLARLGPEEADGDRRVLQVRALRAMAARDTAAIRRLVQDARRWEDGAVGQFAAYLASLPPDPAGGRLAIRELIEPHRDPALIADLYRFLAVLHLANGRWAAAREALADARRANSTVPLEWYRRIFDAATEWSIATLPLPFADSTLERMRRTAASSDLPLAEIEIDPEGDLSIGTAMWLSALNEPSVQEAMRLYTLGVLSLRIGDAAAATEAASELASLARYAAAGRLVRDLDRGLRAWIAWHEGRPEQGLQILEGMELGAPSMGVTGIVPFFARANERFLRGELLTAAGRDGEALPWFASIGELSVMESPLRGLAHLRQAEIHDRLGNRAEAAAHYARLAELWAESDPDFQPLVEEARGRRDALAVESPT